MLKSLITGILLLCTLITFPQSPHPIKGQVLSAENRQPLAGATISLDRSGAGTISHFPSKIVHLNRQIVDHLVGVIKVGQYVAVF